ncbi:hypothetical protein ACH5BF_01630 [Arcobacter sp. YIC-464]|uniref:hypothetical protein n=1 Tax=Arcobacter sp. YIC-464 TaxID=3376631 RepID=UPI003C1E38C1
MKKIFLILCFFISMLFSNANELKVIIEKDVLDDYLKFIENKDPLKMTDFRGEHSRRSTVELVLLQQALERGGYKVPSLKFILTPSYTRKIVQLKNGSGFSSGTSLWFYDLDKLRDFVYITEPLILKAEYEAGFYTVESNKKALSAKSLEDIQQLTAISNKYWVPDWRTLESLNLKKLINTTKWKFIVRMVSINRGDFLLASFQPTPDLSFLTEGVKLVPIQGLKIGLNDSRHFAISKKYPNSKELFEALNKGIKILRKEGVITKAYKQSGFFNEKVQHWKKLN